MSSGRAMSFGYTCRFVSGGGCCGAPAGAVCARAREAVPLAIKPHAINAVTARVMSSPPGFKIARLSASHEASEQRDVAGVGRHGQALAVRPQVAHLRVR